MHKNQNGFVRIFMLLVVIAIVLVGRYVWDHYHKQYVAPADASKIPAQPLINELKSK